MSDSISEIKDEINLDLLSEYCGEFAENMQYSDDNIMVLKISLENLKMKILMKSLKLGELMEIGTV